MSGPTAEYTAENVLTGIPKLADNSEPIVWIRGAFSKKRSCDFS